MEKLYNIYYKETDEYETTTNNFGKWLKEHNDERKNIGEIPEKESEFLVVSTNIKIY